MTITEPKVQQMEAVTLHTVETRKYKTNTIVLKMKAPLSEETVTKRALLAYVLQKATEQSPSAKELRRRLNDLYGASLSAQLSKKGDFHVISFRMEVANEKYLSDPTPLLEKALRLLAEVVLKPKMENGTFDGGIVAKEKRTLKQRIQSVRDDKMRYANTRLIEEMCKNEPYSLHPYGDEHEVDGISAEFLTSYYREALANDAVDLFIVGDIDEKQVESVVRDAFDFPKRQGNLSQKSAVSDEIPEEKVITETEDLEQGKLNLGYRTYTTYADDDYFALVVFNGILGGFPHSKLFINVREKASLAYYASSRIESHKGLLLIFSGIQSSNFDQAVSIIKEQTEKMRQGDFSDQEFEQTKAMLNNQILETIDNAHGMIEFFYNGLAAGHRRSVDEWTAGVDRVTKDDVIRFADKVKLDTTYFLKGKEGS
ncbi:MAG TPA: pitrilysin family protein [Bacillales bacterium]|nr:pitrilysin family protein [Bacillales bacterium]